MIHELIDAHHHLWDLQAVRYPWLLERGVKRFFGDPTPIQKNYLASDLREDFGQLPVTASVHIQVGAALNQSLTETRWLQSVADSAPGGGFPHGIVAFCDLTEPDAEEQLDQHSESANLRGIRQIVGRSPQEDARTGTADLLNNSQWVKGLGLLAQRNLSFDLQLIPTQMESAANLLSQLPELRVALCHCGSPADRSAEAMSRWRAGIHRLAQLPNVYCKISGFGMFDPHWNVQRIEEIFHYCVDSFGPQRCMLGSNYPVDGLYRQYSEIFGSFFRLLRSYCDTEQQAIAADTARRFYRL